MSKSKALNLRDKISENEMDLSLCNLTEVPVRELAAFPKATALDLSCNNLSILPLEFCSLTHLVKLDLSKNQLSSLPADFGCLVALQHLDLYNNKLASLPVSFSRLRVRVVFEYIHAECARVYPGKSDLSSLKWLDLKDNPLESTLAKVAGDCLDEKQCKQCASRVLQHMRAVQEEVDKERERRRLKEKEIEKKKEAQQRAKEAREREARKREKAEEKERKRREYDAQKAARAAQEQRGEKKTDKSGKDHPVVVKPVPKAKRSLLSLLLRLLLLLLLGLFGALSVCQLTGLKREAVCNPLNVLFEETLSWARGQEVVRLILQKLSEQQP